MGRGEPTGTGGGSDRHTTWELEPERVRESETGRPLSWAVSVMASSPSVFYATLLGFGALAAISLNPIPGEFRVFGVLAALGALSIVLSVARAHHAGVNDGQEIVTHAAFSLPWVTIVVLCITGIVGFVAFLWVSAFRDHVVALGLSLALVAKLGFAFPAVVLGDRDPFSALVASWKLSKRYRAQTFGLLLLLLAGLFVAVFAIVFTSGPKTTITVVATFTFLGTLYLLASARIWVQLVETPIDEPSETETE